MLAEKSGLTSAPRLHALQTNRGSMSLYRVARLSQSNICRDPSALLKCAYLPKLAQCRSATGNAFATSSVDSITTEVSFPVERSPVWASTSGSDDVMHPASAMVALKNAKRFLICRGPSPSPARSRGPGRGASARYQRVLASRGSAAKPLETPSSHPAASRPIPSPMMG